MINRRWIPHLRLCSQTTFSVNNSLTSNWPHEMLSGQSFGMSRDVSNRSSIRHWGFARGRSHH